MIKQTEIFAFLAIFFLVSVYVISGAGDDGPDDAEDEVDPPIIMLSEENEAYRFELGSALPTPAFRAALDAEIIPELNGHIDRCSCNAIEIVGHTDGVAVSRQSNLDQRLPGGLQSGGLESLSAGSNVDLGMMRAVSVLRLMQEAQRERGQLVGVEYFLPYSAGQMVRRDRSLEDMDAGGEDRSRRRIEIRLLRLELGEESP